MTQSTISTQQRIIAEYSYHDAQGQLAYQTVRYDPKGFKLRRPDGRGGWLWNMGDVTRIPYRLPELLKTPPGSTIYFCEGEKAVEAARSLGVIATTNVYGAGNWTENYNTYFKGRHVVILPDNDEPGRDHAKKVAKELTGVAASVKILDLPGLPEKGDICEWIADGGTKEKLEELVMQQTATARASGQSNHLLDKAAIDARGFLFDVLAGKIDPNMKLGQDFESWNEVVDETFETYKEAFAIRGIEFAKATVKKVLQVQRNQSPELDSLLSTAEATNGHKPIDSIELEELIEVPELPEIARLPESMGNDACEWTNTYIAFGKKWSPWSYDGFHEAIALWALSVVAAGRVTLNLVGKKRITPLYAMLIGRTSVHAKTEAATIARDVIRRAGLKNLLGHNRTTPQKLLSDMSGKVPADYEYQLPEEKEETEEKIRFANSKGWYVDEFGGILILNCVLIYNTKMRE